LNRITPNTFLSTLLSRIFSGSERSDGFFLVMVLDETNEATFLFAMADGSYKRVRGGGMVIAYCWGMWGVEKCFGTCTQASFTRNVGGLIASRVRLAAAKWHIKFIIIMVVHFS
jgi:hypothetical protein